jgi:hypothetical protein
MKRCLAVLLLACLLFPAGLAALDGKKALYVGGTITAKIPADTEGRINTDDEAYLVFIADKTGVRAELPYAKLDSLEYGQKASYRIKTAILVTPWSLFSKKRKHYLSLMWKDEQDKTQGVVLELGKDILRPTVMVIEARSGKKLEFQDEDAKKNYAK